MESQPQNPEFRNNPENFHPCNKERVKLISPKIKSCVSGYPTVSNFSHSNFFKAVLGDFPVWPYRFPSSHVKTFNEIKIVSYLHSIF